MELEKIAESFVLGTLYVETIPSWATDALQTGYDSPSLRQLAGTDVDDHQEIRDLFQESLRELGVSLPSPSEAGLSKAKEIADEIVRGVVTPYVGARTIWTSIYTRFPDLRELRPFVGYASDYEDDEKHREEYERLIIAESRLLLAEPKTE